ncbi:MAG: MqnA/MqnD/SBP family protein, partial [Rikenellaceae bacterium]
MMVWGNITAVSYLNTIPFVFGINRASSSLHSKLLLDVPAKCSENFISGKVSIALIPAADLRLLSSYKLITNYCIGAVSNVRTVVVVSNAPLDQITTIYLDSHSHTSVQLVKILAREKWNITPAFEDLTDYSTIDYNSSSKAYLLIGDKVFDNENKFTHTYDLAAEWIEHTSLPFVFAVWVARDSVSSVEIDNLNRALHYGVTHIEEAVKESIYMSNYIR